VAERAELIEAEAAVPVRATSHDLGVLGDRPCLRG